MTRTSLLAGALTTALAAFVALPAQAIPLSKSPTAPQGVVEQVGRGGGHGGGRGGGHFHGGGGGPRFHGGGGPRFGGRPHFHGHGGHYHGPRFGGYRFRGYPYGYGFGALPYYYSYGGYYGGYSGYGECAPLRRRAIATGSRLWWNRYYECIED